MAFGDVGIPTYISGDPLPARTSTEVFRRSPRRPRPRGRRGRLKLPCLRQCLVSKGARLRRAAKTALPPAMLRFRRSRPWAAFSLARPLPGASPGSLLSQPRPGLGRDTLSSSTLRATSAEGGAKPFRLTISTLLKMPPFRRSSGANTYCLTISTPLKTSLHRRSSGVKTFAPHPTVALALDPAPEKK